MLYAYVLVAVCAHAGAPLSHLGVTRPVVGKLRLCDFLWYEIGDKRKEFPLHALAVALYLFSITEERRQKPAV